MSAFEELTFQLDTAVVLLGLGMLAITAWLGWLAFSRSGYRRGIGILELLRVVIVSLVVVTLLQPEWVETRKPEQTSTLVVLADESDSMRTRDVLTTEGVPMTRAEAIAPLLMAEAWGPADPEAEADFAVVVEPFSSDEVPAEMGTDLDGGLQRVLDGHDNLRGVVVLSDGDWNVGAAPTLAASRYRIAGVPVFGVGVGSPTSLPDLELVRMGAPTFGVVGKPLRIPFTVRSTLAQVQERVVTLAVDGVAAAKGVVSIPAMGEGQGELSWVPTRTGDFTLDLRLPSSDVEAFADNNALSAPISIRQEALSVLVVESYPRWEYRYLRNALERDPGVDVTCLLFHPELDGVGDGRGYIDSFPTAAELSRFDVVFVGDVGIAPDQLQLEQAVLLKQLVSAQAAGLVFLPGRYGFQESLSSSPLADLLPVVLDRSKPTGVGSSTAGHFALTQAGRRSLLTRLDESDAANTEIWRKLPGFHWHAGVLRAKAGAEVLAVHERDRNDAGRVPLLVTKTFGTGKVLYLATDGAWRWREGVEDRYHYRFWAQVARWMAYRRQMAEGQAMRLFFRPDRPEVRDVVTLSANVQDALGAPLVNGTVVVQAVSPTGKASEIRLAPGQGDAAGLFTGSFRPLEPGSFTLVANCAETGGQVRSELAVQGREVERMGRLARFDVLEEISEVTRGRAVGIAQAGRIVEALRALPAAEPVLIRTKIWSHPVWCALLVILLALFWTARKRVGAV